MKHKSINQLAARIWGTANDAQLWNGWRTYGDAWACRYLLLQLDKGSDVRGDRAEIRASIERLSLSEEDGQ